MLEIDAAKKIGSFYLNIKARISASGITALIGPSGAGKSTAAKLVAGLLTPDDGRIAFNGMPFFDSEARVNVPPERRGIGFVFQEHRLFPHMSVLKNLAYGSSVGASGDGREIAATAEVFGISRLLDRRPDTLSGGESQRVSLARAIIAARRLVIMDEPLSSLDESRRCELLEYIAEIPRRFGLPILYITHSSREAERLADSALYIEEGRVTRSGSVPEIIECMRPRQGSAVLQN